MVSLFFYSVAFSGSVLSHYRAAAVFVLKVHCASVMFVLTFVGLVLPILVTDVVGKKEKEERDDRRCYRC